jgi:hypothetical protein
MAAATDPPWSGRVELFFPLSSHVGPQPIDGAAHFQGRSFPLSCRLTCQSSLERPSHTHAEYMCYAWLDTAH